MHAANGAIVPVTLIGTALRTESYALIAEMSCPGPMMFKTRVRL